MPPSNRTAVRKPHSRLPTGWNWQGAHVFSSVSHQMQTSRHRLIWTWIAIIQHSLAGVPMFNRFTKLSIPEALIPAGQAISDESRKAKESNVLTEFHCTACTYWSQHRTHGSMMLAVKSVDLELRPPGIKAQLGFTGIRTLISHSSTPQFSHLWNGREKSNNVQGYYKQCCCCC